MVPTRSTSPLWRRVQFALEEDIAQGVLLPGQQLPPESDLAARFDVHRHTIRRAISRLQEKGVLRAEQGRGTFVQEQTVVYRLDRRARLSRISDDAGRSRSRTVIGAARVRATRNVATGLGVNIGTMVQRVDTLRLIDGKPAVVTSHFYPWPRFEGIADRIKQGGSIMAALEHYGVTDLVHVVSRISARTPSQRDAKLLNQPVSRPILYIMTVSTDEKNRPVQFSQGRFSGSMIELSVRYDRLHGGP